MYKLVASKVRDNVINNTPEITIANEQTMEMCQFIIVEMNDQIGEEEYRGIWYREC